MRSLWWWQTSIGFEIVASVAFGGGFGDSSSLVVGRQASSSHRRWHLDGTTDGRLSMLRRPARPAGGRSSRREGGCWAARRLAAPSGVVRTATPFFSDGGAGTSATSTTPRRGPAGARRPIPKAVALDETAPAKDKMLGGGGADAAVSRRIGAPLRLPSDRQSRAGDLPDDTPPLTLSPGAPPPPTPAA